jgi:ABC-type sugar transport system permease subunit
LKRSRLAYLFVLPSIFFISAFILYPLAFTVYLSFLDWNGLFGPRTFVGLRNFERLATDSNVLTALINNVTYMVLGTIGTVVLGLIIATLLDSKIRGWALFRNTFYFSVLLPSVVTGILFISLYNPQLGLIDSLLGLLGFKSLSHLAWLADPKIALFAVILKDVWQYSGFPMLLFIAAFANIPDEIYEAARVEGASGLQIFFRIRLPLIRQVLATVVTLQILFSFKVFDSLWVMTHGGPGHASEVLSTYLFKVAFSQQDFGYGSAIGIFMAIVIFPASLLYIRLWRLEGE